MPWRVRKIPAQTKPDYAIQKREGDSWTIVGRSESREKAQASVRARRASETKTQRRGGQKGRV